MRGMAKLASASEPDYNSISIWQEFPQSYKRYNLSELPRVLLDAQAPFREDAELSKVSTLTTGTQIRLRMHYVDEAMNLDVHG